MIHWSIHWNILPFSNDNTCNIYTTIVIYTYSFIGFPVANMILYQRPSFTLSIKSIHFRCRRLIAKVLQNQLIYFRAYIHDVKYYTHFVKTLLVF